eukprot:g31184.t1
MAGASVVCMVEAWPSGPDQIFCDHIWKECPTPYEETVEFWCQKCFLHKTPDVIQWSKWTNTAMILRGSALSVNTLITFLVSFDPVTELILYTWTTVGHC